MQRILTNPWSTKFILTGGGQSRKSMKNHLLKQLAIVITASMILSPAATVFASENNEIINFTVGGTEIIETGETGEETEEIGAQDDVVWFGDSAETTEFTSNDPSVVTETITAAEGDEIQPIEKTLFNLSKEGSVADSVTFRIQLGCSMENAAVRLGTWEGFNGTGEIIAGESTSAYSPGEKYTISESVTEIEINLSGLIPLSKIPEISVSGSVPGGTSANITSTMEYTEIQPDFMDMTISKDEECSDVEFVDMEMNRMASALREEETTSENVKRAEDTSNTEDPQSTETGDETSASATAEGEGSDNTESDNIPGQGEGETQTHPVQNTTDAKVTPPVIVSDKEKLVIKADNTGDNVEGSAVITVNGLEYLSPQPASEGTGQEAQEDPLPQEEQAESANKTVRIILDIQDNLYPGKLILPSFENAKVTGVTVDGIQYKYNGNTVNILRTGPIVISLEVENTKAEVKQVTPATLEVFGVIEEDAADGDIEKKATISGSIEDGSASYQLKSIQVTIVKEKPVETHDEQEQPAASDDNTNTDQNHGYERPDPIQPVNPQPAKPQVSDLEPESQDIIDYIPSPIKETVLEVIDFTKGVFGDDTEEVTVTTRSAAATVTRNSDSSSRQLRDTVSQRTQTEKIEDSYSAGEKDSARSEETKPENNGENEEAESQTGMSLEEEINTAVTTEKADDEAESEDEDNTRNRKDTKRLIEGCILVALLLAFGGAIAFLIYAGKKEDEEEKDDKKTTGGK